jgi:hypothetical protein
LVEAGLVDIFQCPVHVLGLDAQVFEDLLKLVHRLTSLWRGSEEGTYSDAIHVADGLIEKGNTAGDLFSDCFGAISRGDLLPDSFHLR